MGRKKVRFEELRKDWNTFKTFVKQDNELNIFVYFYSLVVSLLVWAILVFVPAYFTLFILFLIAAIKSGFPLNLYSSYLISLVGILGMPSLIYMWNESARQYQAEFKRLGTGRYAKST